jgi:hypothetical protein
MQHAICERHPLYQVFLDLTKAYDTVDHDRAMDIFAGYGIGPNICRVISTYWELETIIPKSAKYFGTPFHPENGLRQGGPKVPTKFDLIIDSVIREWCSITSFCHLDLFLSVWYADDGRLSGYSRIEVQRGIDIFVDLFARVGLKLNTTKSKFMVVLLDPPPLPTSPEGYAHRFDPSLPSFKDQRHAKVPCPHPTCQKHKRLFTSGYLKRHLREHHRIFSDPTPPSLAPSPHVYQISIPHSGIKIPCPVPGCPASPPGCSLMHSHFCRCHIDDIIIILEEGPLPRCPQCGMFLKSITDYHL